jgi:hypothetical protein
MPIQKLEERVAQLTSQVQASAAQLLQPLSNHTQLTGMLNEALTWLNILKNIPGPVGNVAGAASAIVTAAEPVVEAVSDAINAISSPKTVTNTTTVNTSPTNVIPVTNSGA